MKFSDELTEKICKHLKQGATITTTCEAVGIHKDTFYEWMKKKSDFSDAIKKTMAIPDKKVENALFKLAIGTFRYTEKHYEQIRDVKGKLTDMQLVKTIRKRVLPNVTAQIFHLKNRKPDEWKDRHDVAHSGSVQFEISEKFLPKDKKKGKDKT